MPALIGLSEFAPGWYEARFAFDRRLVDTFKQTPGCRWVPEKKLWTVPGHALPVLEQRGAKFTITKHYPITCPPALPSLLAPLRSYQQEAVGRLVSTPGYVLGWGMRVGKTSPASVAAAHLLNAGLVRTVLVLAPNGVKSEWLRQFPKFTGLPMHSVDGTKGIEEETQRQWITAPYLALAYHYELLMADKLADETVRPVQTFSDLMLVLRSRGGFVVIADELHEFRDRKSPRAKLLDSIARDQFALYRWVLTGTPLRNYPADMFPLWNFVQPDSMGSWSKFTGRYADGHMGTYGWKAEGRSNEDELALRLKSICWRLSRQEVAPWMPATDRKVIVCDLNAEQRAAYAKQEVAIGPKALAAMEKDKEGFATEGLKQLARSTSVAKMPTTFARARYHTVERAASDGRPIKIVVFAYHHETLSDLWDVFEEARNAKRDPYTVPVFVAGGWMTKDKREAEIERWKKTPGSAVLLANALSSGRGIDLSDADASIFIELAWVPADFLQAEARHEDVHQGKRKTGALVEYVLARGTIDEDMARLLIEKIAATESVVGADAQTRGVDSTLREAGVVDRSVLSLTREDPATVAAALDMMRARLLGEMRLGAEDGDNNVEDTEEDDEEAEEDE